MGPEGWPGPPGIPGTDLVNSNAIYTIWGTVVCPGDDIALYDGFAALPKHQDPGGGTNFMCLPDPFAYELEFDPDQDPTTATSHSSVVGVIYNTLSDEPLYFVNGEDVECAVCSSEEALQLMIPGTSLCPNETDWTTIYNGYLMSSRDTPSETLENDDMGHFRTKNICVTSSPTTLVNITSTLPEAQIYHVYLDCITGASLGCSQDPIEQLTCAVCGYTPP